MQLVDYDNLGNRKTVDINEIINYGPTSTGYNAPNHVILNGVEGFLKKTSKSTTTFDKFEFLISKLSNMLNIRSADTFFLENGTDKYTFSKSVINKGEKLFMATDLSKYLLENNLISEEEKEELLAFNNSLETGGSNDNKLPIATVIDNIDFAINIFIRMIEKLNLENEEEIKGDYIRMCFFDSLTGNKDRNSNNFGLVEKDGLYSFAPLFDSSTISMPNVPDEYVAIMGYYMDRVELASFITSKYTNYISDIQELDLDEVNETINNISSNILNSNEKKWFDNSIMKNINNSLFDRLNTNSISR